MLNETNGAEVVANLLDWISKLLTSKDSFTGH